MSGKLQTLTVNLLYQQAGEGLKSASKQGRKFSGDNSHPVHFAWDQSQSHRHGRFSICAIKMDPINPSPSIYRIKKLWASDIVTDRCSLRPLWSYWLLGSKSRLSQLVSWLNFGPSLCSSLFSVGKILEMVTSTEQVNKRSLLEIMPTVYIAGAI